ncbi:hypothetical protein CF645_37895 [Burkholderia pseudomallei]|nr:hypothetical protein CF645_37895 [Burkholderia pseudomallei]
MMYAGTARRYAAALAASLLMTGAAYAAPVISSDAASAAAYRLAVPAYIIGGGSSCPATEPARRKAEQALDFPREVGRRREAVAHRDRAPVP